MHFMIVVSDGFPFTLLNLAVNYFFPTEKYHFYHKLWLNWLVMLGCSYFEHNCF